MNTQFRLALCAAAVLTLSVGNLKADIAYTVTSTGYLGTTDLNTGVFSAIGGQSFLSLQGGLGVANGALYAVMDGGSSLWKVDTSTGGATNVGSDSTAEYRYLGSTTSGLYAIGYEPGQGWGNLLSIDPKTGVATLIGSTGLDNVSGVGSLSNNSSTLYFSEGKNLYTIDTTTGKATLVGSTGDAQIGAMLWDGGTLYGSTQDWQNGTYPYTTSVDTLNTTTGAATTGPSWPDSQYGAIVGLAPDPLPSSTVPELDSTSLLAIAAGALGVVRLRCRAAR